MSHCPHCGLSTKLEAPVTRGRIHLDEQNIVHVDGKRASISGHSKTILVAMIRANGRVLTRDHIVAILDSDVEYRTVDVHIRRLRVALERAAPGLANYLATEVGMGYYWSETPIEIRNGSSFRKAIPILNLAA